ncbi:MAG: class I SAM-dependent methyltransferase [Cyclobacteriaceae bacterium]|nr:class I SAM-dependent methyltransferase [Cyclobacteriaceae bacterium HetDA_MAG_MS6]
MRDKILSSWSENAAQWGRVIENEGIESRKVTNNAIVDTIIEYQPDEIYDLGCGEGWLTRCLAGKDLKVTGIDGTADLILQARKKGDETYWHQTFEEMANSAKLPNGPYEAAIFNFCLYEKELTEQLLKTLPAKLSQRKLIFIQTLHPAVTISTSLDYKDQWMADSWKGLPSGFTSPHSWYFRAMASWIKLFSRCNLKLIDLKEPLAIDGSKPASVIFILTAHQE